MFLLQGAAGELLSQSNEYGRCEYVCNAFIEATFLRNVIMRLI